MTPEEDQFTCAAFPGGIPWPIWYEQVSHFDPIEGDGGIVFHSAKDEPGSRIITDFIRSHSLD